MIQKELLYYWAVVVVQWSAAFSPSILRRSKFESCWLLKFSVRKDEIKKRPGLAHL